MDILCNEQGKAFEAFSLGGLADMYHFGAFFNYSYSLCHAHAGNEFGLQTVMFMKV